jgi:hypothetical protein
MPVREHLLSKLRSMQIDPRSRVAKAFLPSGLGQGRLRAAVITEELSVFHLVGKPEHDFGCEIGDEYRDQHEEEKWHCSPRDPGDLAAGEAL